MQNEKSKGSLQIFGIWKNLLDSSPFRHVAQKQIFEITTNVGQGSERIGTKLPNFGDFR
jgi:hypothetical protein